MPVELEVWISRQQTVKTLYESLKEKNISFYITEHIAGLNEQMRQLGLGCLIRRKAVCEERHILL